MRPRYHYAPAANWLSDPNGLVWQDGEWHMFYQYNPFGEEWGHMSWGHAVSPDLANWKELPVALAEADSTMIFSGSAVIDHADTAGFGPDAMIAIYTGARTDRQHQFQSIAASTDGGRTFATFDGNPVLDLQMADFRDPNVFWHGASQHWIMSVVLSEENRALLYRSPDLKTWERLSEVERDGAPGHLWECPWLVELPVEGSDDTRWLFKVDVLSGAGGFASPWRVGHFDGTRFVPETPWQVGDFGPDFYAAIGWNGPRDEQGRPAWIGWVGNHAYQKFLPKQGWRGAMTLPRRVSLRRDDAGYRLMQVVEPACRALFGPPEPLFLCDGCTPLPAAALITMEGGQDWSIALEDDHERVIEAKLSGGVLTCRRHDAITMQLETIADMAISGHGEIEIWLDSGSIEIFADGGAAVLTMQHRLAGEAWALRGDGDGVVAFPAAAVRPI